MKADRFVLLGRVDRRIVTSGAAQLAIGRDALTVNGGFTINEGLIDFTRSDAPTLSDDVQVVRLAASGATRVTRGGTQAPSPGDPTPPLPTSTSARNVELDLKIGLGTKLRLRGRGIDTGLRGDLRLTAPNGRLAINGTVSAAGGTYAAYGQKLTIDRGQITFNGPPENPQLNIEATRPNIDIRVGVQVTGTAQNPRIRLFSEPEVSEVDKLSWLALGRASDGLGGADTALLQTAALALLAGEGDGITDQFTKAIGLRRTDAQAEPGRGARDRHLARQAVVAALVCRLRTRPERHRGQLSADLPHRAQLHIACAVRLREFTRRDLDLALGLSASTLRVKIAGYPP